MASITFVAVVMAGLSAQHGAGDDLPTSSELTAELIRRDSGLFALSAVYRQLPSSSGAGKGEYSRREVAIRAPDWFYRRNSHGDRRMHWRDDPFAKSRVLAPGRHFLFSDLNRIVEEQPLPTEGSTPDGPSDEALLHWLCWWPYPAWPAPKKAGREWQFAKLFAADEYRVRDGVEVVNSCECCVLELPSVDVMWLDLECPQKIIRRDLCAGAYGSVAERLEYGDYREVKPGLWIPHRVRSTQYDAFAHSDGLRARIVRSGTFVLSAVLVNENVAYDRFSFPLPPGSVADVSADGPVTPITSGQADHIEALLDWTSRIMGADGKSAETVWYYLGALCGGFVIVALPGAMLRSRHERNRSSPGMAGCQNDVYSIPHSGQDAVWGSGVRD